MLSIGSSNEVNSHVSINNKPIENEGVSLIYSMRSRTTSKSRVHQIYDVKIEGA
jgi:ABC-type transporter MlaC component